MIIRNIIIKLEIFNPYIADNPFIKFLKYRLALYERKHVTAGNATKTVNRPNKITDVSILFAP